MGVNERYSVLSPWVWWLQTADELAGDLLQTVVTGELLLVPGSVAGLGLT